jgi:hypothetical protein
VIFVENNRPTEPIEALVRNEAAAHFAAKNPAKESSPRVEQDHFGTFLRVRRSPSATRQPFSATGAALREVDVLWRLRVALSPHTELCCASVTGITYVRNRTKDDLDLGDVERRWGIR